MKYCKCGCGAEVKKEWKTGHNIKALGPSNKNCFIKITYHLFDGYVYIYDPLHTRAKKNGFYKRANIIAEEKIGRKLKTGEIVHHIDQNKENDSPENLLVITKQQHDRLHVLVSEKCFIENCETKHHARGLCRKHYNRYYKYKEPMPLSPTKIHIRIKGGVYANRRRRKKMVSERYS